jgi:anti-sigma factor ChrR (cupin superfamily)
MMKATHVSLRPTEAAAAAGRPALTPELLAACGARYSRSNAGLDAILARIDPAQLDRSVDSIFRLLDYGHQSIADMAPVAMFLDGISQWLAYYVWSLCSTAGGQESSTRYIRFEEREASGR